VSQEAAPAAPAVFPFTTDNISIAAVLRAAGHPVTITAVSQTKAIFESPGTPEVLTLTREYFGGTLQANYPAIEAARTELHRELKTVLDTYRRAKQARRV